MKLALRDRAWSSNFRRGRGVDLLHVKRNQLWRFEHLIRMPPGTFLFHGY